MNLIEIGGIEFDYVETTSVLADCAYWIDYQRTQQGEGLSDFSRERLLLLLSAFADAARIQAQETEEAV